MRQPIHLFRFLVLALAFVVAGHSAAFADDRAEARTHYQAGVKFYSAATTAARSASSAPRSSSRPPISTTTTSRSATTSSATPSRRSSTTARTSTRCRTPTSAPRLTRASSGSMPRRSRSPPRRPRSSARPTTSARRRRRARPPRRRSRPRPRARPRTTRLAAEAATRRKPGRSVRHRHPTGLRRAEERRSARPATPSTGVGLRPATRSSTASSQIDIDAIRDQRIGGAASGIPADDNARPRGRRGEPAPQRGQRRSADRGAAPTHARTRAAAAGGPAATSRRRPTPVYKKWWFWAVVAVSAYVVYQIASDSSKPQTGTARLLPEVGAQNAQPGGLTLMRW